MKIRFYGHACFSVECGGSTLLFDPFISPNAKASHIDLAQVKADYILLSHGHFDHVADAVALAKQNDATVVGSWEVVAWIQKHGIEKSHPMNHGGKWKFPFGTVKMVNAVHSSGLPDGSYGGNPAGFVVETTEGSFYYSGDTALTYDMKLIGEQFKLQFAVLPIGDNFTMGVEDAATAATWVGARTVLGVHFDTFGYIVVDHDAAKAAFAKKDITLHLADIGQEINL